jgi:two-component system response regulator CpxR
MSVISVFSSVFCGAEQLIDELAKSTELLVVTDQDLLARAAQAADMSIQKMERVLSSKASIFNKFTHEKERAIAHLRLQAANALARDQLVIHGYVSQLIPKSISHVLRVCLIADLRHRLKLAMEQQGLKEKEAARQIHSEDENRAIWVDSLWGQKDPWQPSWYDMLLPTDKKSIPKCVEAIRENASKAVLQPTDSSRRAAADFMLAALVETELAGEGHNVEVSAEAGVVTLRINKHVLLLNRLEEELKQIVGKVAGVKDVITKVGKDFYQADIYRKYDFQTPSRVLLVDDEREFVETLSERLSMREMGSAVAYDGRSALDLIEQDEPEVMILDLKMPGIDGIEVLRRVKQTRPEIEVIILTGQGTEADRKQCMELGAFAYLQKPVDIELLTETLKRANAKVRGKE